MNKDLYNNVKVENAMDVTVMSSTTDFVGNAIDTSGFLSGVISTTCTAYTSGSVVGRVTESATSGGTYTDIPAARIIGSVMALGAVNTIGKIGYIADLQFVKLVVGGGAATVASVIGTSVLGDPNSAAVDTHVI
jgi:hypothetical protein